MKKLFMAFAQALAIVGCTSENNRYVIEGVLFGGGKFEGERIYLVPFDNGSAARIDSAVVHDGFFRFEGQTDSSEVFILRMRPMMRLFIEELLIVREPGHIHTVLNRSSSVAGTPLNDSLHRWKLYKAHNDSILSSWHRRMRTHNTDSVERITLKYKSDSLRQSMLEYNKERVAYNRDNAFGALVNRFTH